MTESKKKLLFVVEAMGGGVFTYIVDLANELVNTYDMYIAYAVREQTPSDYNEYFDKRIHLIEVKNFGRSINLMKDFKAFFEIKRIANQVHPDMIHLHSSKAGALGRWAFNGKKIPLFYTPHGYSFLMQNYSLTKRFAYRLMEMICGKRICTTISCSEGEYYESLRLTKRSTYVNNGINVNELQQIVNSVDGEFHHPFTVFTLGRICYQKNPSLFNQVALAMPDLKFLWIGDGELKDELTAPNIEITGWIKRKEALERSMFGDVFLLTSLWEGLSMSLLEAMNMKKPCAVSNVIGNRDVIHNGKNGFVCNEICDYIQSIKAVQVNNVKEMVDQAYADVLKVYNIEVMAQKYCEIYTAHLVREKTV